MEHFALKNFCRVLRLTAAWFLFSTCAAPGWSQKNAVTLHRISLSQNWQFRQASNDPASQAKWYPAAIPGDVHLDLLRNKLIPDPYFRDNESRLQWIQDADWEYETSVDVSSELLKSDNIDLVFDGLDTNAQVTLNGKAILLADNMFRQWRVNAKPYLHLGSNDLHIRFFSPIKTAARYAADDTMQPRTRVPDKAYLRKAAYEYGWDWGPRFVTNGIWRPVYFEAWGDARIDELQIAQPDVTAAAAHITASVHVQASTDMRADVQLTFANGDRPVEMAQNTTLHSGDNIVAFPITIAHPKLWYPAGYGSQPLYTFKARIRTDRGSQDEREARTGLRSVVLHRVHDKWGRSFEFIVNGIPIFIKGADVIPFDSFPNRVDEARYRDILQSAKDANMNMIRLWGGGYYETDTFYNLCDELGLLVWHDFMFASSIYPGDYDWKQGVQAEIDYQVKRLRNHPSIAIWSGNNESESVINAFYGGASAESLQIWKNYLTTFSSILPGVVERDDPEIPYWPSSPSSDYEPTSDKFQSGDAHDWSIWHGREPFTNYEQHFYRFTSEYGFQSFPELRTVESFTEADDRANIFTPVMRAHQKNDEGNAIIHEYMLRDYSEPKDFSSLLYVSQVLQAEGVKVGAEHMRRSRPRIMGSLYWQLNDCWPVASWSSIDYFGRWKALQYYARRFYNPILVSPALQDGNVLIYGVSDKLQPIHATLRARVMTMKGALMKDQSTQVTLDPLSSRVYEQFPLQSLLSPSMTDLSQVFLVATLTVDGAEVSSNLMYLAPTKQIHLPAARLTTDLEPAEDGYRLNVTSDTLARDVYIAFNDIDAKFSDNYFDLLPGQSKQITIHTRATLDQLRKQLHVVSLVDAFGPEKHAETATEAK